MITLKKSWSLLLAIAFVSLFLSSCGSTEESTAETDPAPAVTQSENDPVLSEQSAADQENGDDYTWGNIAVTIPERTFPTNGSVADNNDPNCLWVQETGNPMHYIIINATDDTTARESIRTTQEMNNAGDIEPFELSGITWTGIGYEWQGTPCWMIYSDIGDTCFLLQGYGFSLDGVETNIVLSTVHAS